MKGVEVTTTQLKEIIATESGEKCDSAVMAVKNPVHEEFLTAIDIVVTHKFEMTVSIIVGRHAADQMVRFISMIREIPWATRKTPRS